MTDNQSESKKIANQKIEFKCPEPRSKLIIDAYHSPPFCQEWDKKTAKMINEVYAEAVTRGTLEGGAWSSEESLEEDWSPEDSSSEEGDT